MMRVLAINASCSGIAGFRIQTYGEFMAVPGAIGQSSIGLSQAPDFLS